MILAVLTHPISPISLGCYILAYILVSFFLKKEEGRSIVSSINSSITVIFMLGVVWFAWTALYAMTNYQGIATALLNIFNFGFLDRLLNVSSFTIGGQGFIYPEIHTLGLLIYGLFFALVLFPFLEYFIYEILGYRKGKIDRILYNKMALSLAAIINAVLGFFLFLSSGERFLLGRGLLYFLFFGSIVFATYFINKGQLSKKIKNIVAFSLVIFLFISFPIAAYSKEAYNSFTPSADAGLVFLSSKVDLSNKNISMGVDQQLATYLDLNNKLYDLPFPSNLTEDSPQVVVLKLNSYYVISMRYDLTFTNNSYTMLEEELHRNLNYCKIYSNSRFEVYLRNR
jgi:hypothetical protein